MKIRRTIEEQKPQEDIYDLPGEVNKYGVKILLDGSQWIIDAQTGQPAKRHDYDYMLGNGGWYLWVKKGEKLRSLDPAFASIWDKTLKKEMT